MTMMVVMPTGAATGRVVEIAGIRIAIATAVIIRSIDGQSGTKMKIEIETEMEIERGDGEAVQDLLNDT